MNTLNTALDVIRLNTWQEVSTYADKHSPGFTCSYVYKASSGRYPADAFSLGQLASKAWLLSQLKPWVKPEHATMAILGCWIGSMVEPLFVQHPTIKQIWGFDNDTRSIELADEFNHELVSNNWRFKGIVDDVNVIDWHDPQFETSGQLLESRPDVIINTSAEHMASDWFFSVASDQLVVMQTNNNPDLMGHINTCDSLIDMMEKYPLHDIQYAGEMITPLYSRYMQIGYTKCKQ
jgi:hypothetical protein